LQLRLVIKSNFTYIKYELKANLTEKEGRKATSLWITII